MSTEGTREKFAGVGRLPQGVIYPDLVHGGMVETLVQNTDAFNAASRNAIQLVTQRRLGDFHQETFFKNVSNLVTRREVDVSPDNPAATPTNVPIDEKISVKLNRKIGPVDHTLDSFRKLGDSADFEVLSFLLGEQIAKAMQVDMLDSGLYALVAAITAQSDLTHDSSGSPATTLDTLDLTYGLQKFGDAASRVSIWVMHSTPFFQLVRDQITRNIDGISSFNIFEGNAATMGRPVLVTDSAALLNSDTSPETYITLGLTENALILEDSEEDLLHTDVITGNENIVTRLQGEYAYNVQVKGAKWDVANGGVNPSAATLGTTTNWDKVVTSVKDMGGIAIRSAQ